MNDRQPKSKMQFIFTWKVIVFAIFVFVLVRLALRLLEVSLRMGLSDTHQVILTGIIGTLATFAFARKKTGEGE